MKLTTTFKLLHSKGACTDGYRKLAKYLGGVDAYGEDKEINLLTILDSNGVDDAAWSLRATVQDADVINRLIACDFAESVLHIFESKRPGDDRPRKAIEAARGFAAGTVSIEDMRKARAYAADAADAADAAAAYAADAADAADAAAAYAADAAYAAYAADAADAADAAAAYAADAAYAAAYAYAADAADAAAYAYAADAADASKSKREQFAEIMRKHLVDEE